MTVTQISIFVENKPGRFAEISTRLERAKVKTLAFCIADAGDFGIIRLVVNRPELATKALKGFAGSSIQVIATSITEKFSVSKIADLLGSKKINIDYAYTSTMHIGGNATLILRVDDIERTEKTLKEKGAKVLVQEDLS
ncbi:MAG: acetolactate synthase [Nitrososphaerales archaeon]